MVLPGHCHVPLLALQLDVRVSSPLVCLKSHCVLEQNVSRQGLSALTAWYLVLGEKWESLPLAQIGIQGGKPWKMALTIFSGKLSSAF